MFKVYISESAYQRVVGSATIGQSYLFKLLKQQPVQLLSASDIEKIKSYPENVLMNPSALFILDITHSEALAIKKSFDVMCMSSDCPDISPLIDVNDIHIAKEHERLGKGWDTVLDSVEMLPSNALLMMDRYLFASKFPTAANGITNIMNILLELLPQKFLGGNYHVTIVFDNMTKDAYYTFDEIAQQLEEIKQQLNRDYPITMEVLGITSNVLSIISSMTV